MKLKEYERSAFGLILHGSVLATMQCILIFIHYWFWRWEFVKFLFIFPISVVLLTSIFSAIVYSKGEIKEFRNLSVRSSK